MPSKQDVTGSSPVGTASITGLDDLIDATFAAASNQIIGTRGTSPTMFSGFVGSELRVIVPAAWQTNTQKKLFVVAFRDAMRAAGCDAYTVASEMWFARMTIPDGKLPNLDTITPPKQRPDRREGLMIYAEDATGTKTALWEIKRDWKGAVAQLIKDPMTDRMQTRSLTFGGLLTDDPRRAN